MRVTLQVRCGAAYRKVETQPRHSMRHVLSISAEDRQSFNGETISVQSVERRVRRPFINFWCFATGTGAATFAVDRSGLQRCLPLTTRGGCRGDDSRSRTVAAGAAAGTNPAAR